MDVGANRSRSSFVHSDIGFLHNLGPMTNLGSQELAKFRRRAASWLGGHLGDGVLYARSCQRLIHRLVQELDSRARRSGLRQYAEPILDDQVGKSRLTDGRHVFQGGQPSWSRHGERTQLARGDEINDR